jgi:signal transduction histidine kinase
MISPADILRANILIVDDQEANISLLEQMLRGANYVSIASTRNPAEVAELHRRNRYDLILLDLQMPGMDGFQVIEALKQVETGGYLPVLVITAQPGHKLQALKAGARDFVSKPFELAEVLLRVRNLLEVRLLHREIKRLYDELVAEHLLLQAEVAERKRVEASLKEAQALLSVHAGNLDALVAVRTAELAASNQQLGIALASVRKANEQHQALILELQIMQRKLRQQTRQIIGAQEEERKQISRELHDEVVQPLVSLNLELAALGKGAAPALKRRIVHAQKLVEKSVSEVHRFARKLRPTMLDDLGLIPALHAYNKSLAERKKLKICLTAFAGVEALGEAERTVLFRVAQEALTNVVRHAHATQVTMNLSEVAGAVRLEISDDGKSFPVEKVASAKNPKRLGLLGMKERLEMVGGSLVIESVPGAGTTVRAEIPFVRRPNPVALAVA